MDKVKNYVEELFNNTPKTSRVLDLKNELIMDLSEKYDDLIKDGKKESDAYKEVISSIGEIDELISSINNDYIINDNMLKTKRKTALVVSISVGIYILSLIAVIVLSELELPDYIVVSSFFTLVGIATCMIVYHFMSLPKYIKNDETIVEEFKEWKNKNSKKSEIKKTINSIIWTLTVIIYLLVSFSTMAWHITWIVFIIASLFEQVVKLIMAMKE